MPMTQEDMLPLLLEAGWPSRTVHNIANTPDMWRLARYAALARYTALVESHAAAEERKRMFGAEWRDGESRVQVTRFVNGDTVAAMVRIPPEQTALGMPDAVARAAHRASAEIEAYIRAGGAL